MRRLKAQALVMMSNPLVWSLMTLAMILATAVVWGIW